MKIIVELLHATIYRNDLKI